MLLNFRYQVILKFIKNDIHSSNWFNHNWYILVTTYWFVLIGEGKYDENIGLIIDLSLMFFTSRLIQLVGVMNPMVQELVAFIKNRGNSETKD